MIFSHQTLIKMESCTVEDGVYKQIVYDIMTFDMSLDREEKIAIWTPFVLDLPPPPANLIPFEQVDGRAILKWIDELVPTQEILSCQEMNTQKLNMALVKYDHQHR